MEIIVHCSDSYFGNAILIDSWHRERGWRGIGYHAVILNGHITASCFNKYFDGVIETGRPFDDNTRIEGWETGAHTLGKNDRIGVCLIGESGKFTQAQTLSLISFLKEMRDLFGEITISQHSDHDPRKPYCAGLSKEFIKALNTLLS